MPVTNLYSVNKKIIGIKNANNARVDFLTDALGSATSTVNQSAQVVQSARYKPYGAPLTGTLSDNPAFNWVGSHGYRRTGHRYSDIYVRNRHYNTLTGTWSTADPLRFKDSLNLFEYSRCSPATKFDYTGLYIFDIVTCEIPEKNPDQEKALQRAKGEFARACKTLKGGGFARPICKCLIDKYKPIDDIYRKNTTDFFWNLHFPRKPYVFPNWKNDCYSQFCDQAVIKCNWGSECCKTDKAAACMLDHGKGQTPYLVMEVCLKEGSSWLNPDNGSVCDMKTDLHLPYEGCALNRKKCYGYPNLFILLHEMAHACGGDYHDLSANDFKWERETEVISDRIACCMLTELSFQGISK